MTAQDQSPHLSQSLCTELTRLRQLNTLEIQSNWQIRTQECDLSDIFKSADKPAQLTWPIAELNARQHIAWPRGFNIIWLYQSIIVPSNIKGYPLTGLILRIALTWWAEDAQIYIDGQHAQSGDLFECFTRLCLCEHATPGQTFEIAIRLVSPGHDEGALVRSQLIYELLSTQPTPEPSFIADELHVLATLEPTTQQHIQSALTQLDWQSLTAQSASPNADELWENLSTPSSLPPATIHPFQQSLSQLRRSLKPFSKQLKQHSISCIGHAHLDMAWLWPIKDTWDAAERTFKSILNLQKDFPELTYTHSSPALFEWIEQNRPELFSQIQQKVKEGSWSIDAGLWIEPEFNIISGESIARQILYGQRYCQEKFGEISTIAWLPDSFGFCWQLPQLLTKGGISTFATLKLRWNDTTDFPHSLFWWESPDGSRIRSLMLPAIGTDIDPTKMADYACEWENRTHIPDTLWLPGMGDHGGGPTRDMLEKSKRWEKSPFFPNLSFTTAETYINGLNQTTEISNKPEHSLPVWTDELYLELHRGCYTSHADQKHANRRCEDLLYQAEVFATIAQITADQPYPKSQLETAWKKLLFNQFHDILPGTSIPEVFVETDREWQQVENISQQVLEESLSAIASQIPLPTPPHPNAKPILIFNPLSWPTTSLIELTPPHSINPESCQICDATNQIIPHQLSTETSNKLFLLAKDLPAVGYKLFWISPCINQTNSNPPKKEYILENKHLKAIIDPKTGQIKSLVHKQTNKETFLISGNQLQTFQDKGQYWDAWNIDPDYQDKPLPSPTLKSIQWLENGPVYQKIRTHFSFQNSTITQDYILDKDTPFLKIATHILWKESQVLLKANFPLTITAKTATYEIPFGAISRTTKPQTKAEKAKWEVPALRWADLSQLNTNRPFGVSILTDCKHGFDASPTHLRLTLLKSPTWPDPTSDRGEHKFTYAIYPHTDRWQTAKTVNHARELNICPLVHSPQPNPLKPKEKNHTHSFLELQNHNVILSAFKPSENNPNEFVIRCYESSGENTTFNIRNALNFSQTHSSKEDLLEQSIPNDNTKDMCGWEIATYRLKASHEKGPAIT